MPSVVALESWDWEGYIRAHPVSSALYYIWNTQGHSHTCRSHNGTRCVWVLRCAIYWLHRLLRYQIRVTMDSIDTCQHMLVNRVITVFQFEHTGTDCSCVFVHHRSPRNNGKHTTQYHGTVWAVSITSMSQTSPLDRVYIVTGYTGYVYHISPGEQQALVWCPHIPCCVLRPTPMGHWLWVHH